MRRYLPLFIPLLILLLTAGTCNGPDNTPPALTITPSSLSLDAGSAPVTFQATLTNTSGEVSWALEPTLGTLSSNTGLETTYTPPPSVAGTSTVTLGASLGDLSAEATITVTPVIPTNDTTPPTVLNLTPANAAKDASARGSAVVVFSETIKADTVTEGSVTVSSKDGSLSKQLFPSDDGKTLTIVYRPNGVPDTITITLESTLTDLAGNALQTTPWSFDLPTWQTLSNALDITPNNFAFEPSVGVGTSDNPDEQNLFVAWYEQDVESGQNRVYVKGWNGASWQQLGNALNTSSSNSASDPSLVVDSQNRPVVAFQENDSVSGDSNIYVKRWSGSTWVTVGSAVATGFAEHPSLAVSQDTLGVDTLGVAFANANGTNKAIYFKAFNGLDWQFLGAELNDVSTQNADFPSLEITPPNDDVRAVPFVAFQEFDGTSNNIYVKTWNDTTSTWDKLEAELDVAVAKEATRPSLRLFFTTPIVAWQEEGSTNTDIYVKAFTNMTWETLGNDDYKDQAASEPFLATFPVGRFSDLPFENPTVVWRGNDGAGQNVYGKSYSVRNGGWLPLPEIGLEPFNTLDKAGENPVMAMSTDDAYVAFAEFDSTTASTNLVVKRYNAPLPQPQ
jgi:Bacterial Ig-like domain